MDEEKELFMIDRRFVTYKPFHDLHTSCAAEYAGDCWRVFLSSTVYNSWASYLWSIYVYKLDSDRMIEFGYFDTYAEAEKWLIESGYL